MIIIVTKKQFINHAKGLEDPVIISESDEYYPFLNLWFMLHERKGIKKSLQLDGCRLSRPEWEAGKTDDCIKRIEKMTEKYDRWLKEAKEEKDKDSITLPLKPPEGHKVTPFTGFNDDLPQYHLKSRE